MQILEEIEEASIRIYQFPECDSDEDEDFVEINKDLKVFSSYFEKLISINTIFFSAFLITMNSQPERENGNSNSFKLYLKYSLNLLFPRKVCHSRLLGVTRLLLRRVTE